MITCGKSSIDTPKESQGAYQLVTYVRYHPYVAIRSPLHLNKIDQTNNIVHVKYGRDTLTFFINSIHHVLCLLNHYDSLWLSCVPHCIPSIVGLMLPHFLLVKTHQSPILFPFQDMYIYIYTVYTHSGYLPDHSTIFYLAKSPILGCWTLKSPFPSVKSIHFDPYFDPFWSIFCWFNNI